MWLSLAVPALEAQGGNWNAVSSTPLGRRVEVKLSADPDARIRGLLLSVDSESITLLDKSGVERTYRASEIESVRLRKTDRAPIIGVVVGGALGAIGSGTLENGWAMIPLMGGVGWLLGRGIQGGNWETVYERN